MKRGEAVYCAQKSDRTVLKGRSMGFVKIIKRR
jgi:hypothetical protein